MSVIDTAKQTLLKVEQKGFLVQEKEMKEKINNYQDFTSTEYIKDIRELNKLSEISSLTDKLNQEVKSYEEATSMLSDADFAELANEQIIQSEANINSLVSKLQEYTQKPLQNDDKKAIFEVRPGVGGIEAAIFADDLFKMYIRYCSTKGFRVEQFSLTHNTEGGISEATFLIDEEGSFGLFRFEGGVHRVQRVPKTEALGRIHTSTASVAVIPQIETKDIHISPSDIRIDVYRSSGPGGQSVNTTDSAVRIFHIPTGITVTCQNGKSQHKNKDMAMSVLSSKLQEIEENKRNDDIQKLKNESVSDSERSSKIRTYNFPQSRITDHRVNESWFNIEEVMNGEIGDILSVTSKKLRED